MKFSGRNHNAKTFRKFLGVVLLFGVVFSMPPARCWAADAHYTMWDKGGRGLENLLMGWYEIVNQPVELAKTEDWDKAIFTGLLRGVFYAVGRTLVGAYDLVTFPIPLPAGYQPIMYPELIVPSIPHDKVEMDEKRIQRI